MGEDALVRTLGRAAPAVAARSGPDYRLTPEPELGIGKVQLYGGAGEARLADALGFALPDPGREESDPRGLACAWLAPGEWLLTGPDTLLARLLDAITLGLGDELVLVTDLSHVRASFLLSGPEARARLASASPLDLVAQAFPVGGAARSLLGEAGLFLARQPDQAGWPQFRIIVDQTLAAYAARMIAAPEPRRA